MAVVLSAAWLALSGCGANSGTPPAHAAARASATASAPAVDIPYEKATVPATDLAHLRVLPDHATVGTPYPFDLYAHCGVEVTSFGGAIWRTGDPLRGALPGYIAGTVELLDADSARFVVDLRHFDAASEVLIYHKTSESPPTCK